MAAKEDKRATQIDILQAQAQDSTQPASSPRNQTKGKWKRNVSPSLERTRKIVKGQPRELELPRIVESGHSIVEPVIVRNQSPWDTFEIFFTCDLAGTVFMAQHRHQPSKVIAIRAASTGSADKMLKIFKQIKHDNIISATDCYQDKENKYFLVDDLPLTLEHLVASDAYPNETQLATILGQVGFPKAKYTWVNYAKTKEVLDGVAYLLASGYQHQLLTCSNILIGLDGNIKIGMSILSPFSAPAQNS